MFILNTRFKFKKKNLFLIFVNQSISFCNYKETYLNYILVHTYLFLCIFICIIQKNMTINNNHNFYFLVLTIDSITY